METRDSSQAFYFAFFAVYLHVFEIGEAHLNKSNFLVSEACWIYVYRSAAKDVGTLEYVFQAGEQNSPDAVIKDKEKPQRLLPTL